MHGVLTDKSLRPFYEITCDTLCHATDDPLEKICAQGSPPLNDTKTFESVCALDQSKCRDHKVWTFIYKGQCLDKVAGYFRVPKIPKLVVRPLINKNSFRPVIGLKKDIQD